MRFKYICHRKPERTFSFRGHYFPVCSRCTGIYLGAFTYFLYAFLIPVKYTAATVLLALLLVIPTFIDGFTQLMGYRESNNVLRFSTGLPAGIGLAVLTKVLKHLILHL
ncbi:MULTISPECIES: DUF2085 domain-containing protein [Methanothermobacter]|jgi:uncharacterized membrane protein|uniref:DUF2085 domain-containing protein n=2 Tax=Methanothermobacter TaxID=145260 RepID=A0A7J4MYT8_METTF|nr:MULTISPECIES: DUF2085 domain-containing protein [Methanothermobacter]MBC7110941.1 DUF2085 domain-containing protein [Methanothermobacter sp.]HIH65522.1 DUF2085 domain-containing protein [Methanothermobacter thermautotrophicus]MDK2875146.1 hypothetical protein [Methanothermobacter sp.]MDN5374056.1 hypothetical protein [Methanothermobacter sp.]REE28824.1 putative membrane protein [Methanothermobacter defluvii]